MAIVDEMPSLRAQKKAAKFGWFMFILLIVVVLLYASVDPYTKYLWFQEDGRHPEVFARLYETKGALFVASFIFSLIFFYLNLRQAVKVSLVYLEKPETMREMVVTRILSVVQDHGKMVAKIAAVALAFMFSIGFSDEWNTYLVATHAHLFGRTDPIFGMDLSYFVFDLPWRLAILNFLFGICFLLCLILAAVYLSLRSAAAIGRIDIGRAILPAHLAGMFGFTIVVYGVKVWFERYGFGVVQSSQFVGAGYAAAHQLSVQTGLSVLIVVTGLLMMIAGSWPNGWRISVSALVLCAAVYILGMGIYPYVLQSWVVTPNLISVEGPYASRALSLTRYAYGLDKIDMTQTSVTDAPSPVDLSSARGTLDNMRLWDPGVLQQSAEALQGLKPYYRFRDVDIDRYQIGGKQQMVMVAPRDIHLEGLSSSAQTWVNQRLQYTHGIGVTMSPVNSATPSGQPDFIIRDIPPVTPPEIPIKEPRLYFSDFRTDDGQPEDYYVLVDTKLNEFDYPSEGNDQMYRWQGDRGIRVGGFFQRLAFGISLGDFNLLISPNVTSTTRLLMHRGILDRAQLLYPFLNFDADPYAVIFKGRIYWILDGYTSTDDVPYSNHTVTEWGQVNYIRNPVKVVIDAYSGETTAYAIDPSEAILQTYESIYPGLVKDASALPPGLNSHFRYPEDMFHAQAEQLTQYHLTEKDSTAFLQNEDAWETATERGASGGEEQMAPYYVQMRLPDDPKDEFLLILPFTPRQKGNMSGWLAAHCDPESYGKLRLYEYPRGSILPGPKQMEANFNQNPAIADLNTLLKNAQSELIVGNLLVIPIGHSVIYAEPMFLESTSPGITAIPELKKVVLAVRDRVVVGDTYADALQQLFGNQATAPSAPSLPSSAPATTPSSPPALPNTPTSTSSIKGPRVNTAIGTVPRADVQKALQLANEADAALRAGDFAKYGDLQKQLKATLQKLAAANP